MTYQHLIEKLIKQQDKILPALEQLDQEGKIPEDLAQASKHATEWYATGDIKLGAEEVSLAAPNIEPIITFANKLHDYMGMFPKSTQEHIAEYGEYADALFQMVKVAQV